MVLVSYLLLTAAETVLLESGYELPKLRKGISVIGVAFAAYVIASFIVGCVVGISLSANVVSPRVEIYSFWMVVPTLSFVIYNRFFRSESLLSRR